MATSDLSRLTDHELTLALARLAQSERTATVELIACIAEFDTRRLYLSAGCPSLFVYCCEVLHLSEHATYNRIEAARASRRFPVVLDALRAGTVNLTTVRLLAPHLTQANHADLLDAASHLKKSDIEELIAERFPRPDVAASVRKLPLPRTCALSSAPGPASLVAPGPRLALSTSSAPVSPHLAPPERPATVAPLSPRRYEIRFTVDEGMRDKVRRAQDLLRHAIPSGELAQIFERALNLLLADIARKRAAEVAVPASVPRAVGPGSRHIPAEVRRSVWARDAGRCGFVSSGGRRCSATSFLEFHHVRPYAVGGEATTDNIELRCRAHNGYEADLFYGPLRRDVPADAGALRVEPPNVEQHGGARTRPIAPSPG